MYQREFSSFVKINEALLSTQKLLLSTQNHNVNLEEAKQNYLFALSHTTRINENYLRYASILNN